MAKAWMQKDGEEILIMKRTMVITVLFFAITNMAYAAEALKKNTSKIPVDSSLQKLKAGTTPNPATTKIYSAMVNKSIPDNNSTGINHVFQITDTTIAKSIAACVDIDHTYRGDLVVKIRGPNGKEDILWNKQGGSVDGIKDCQGAPSFANAQVKGTWVVNVADVAAQDVGKWNSVQIKVTH